MQHSLGGARMNHDPTLHTEQRLHTEAFTQRNFHFTRRSFYAQRFYTQKPFRKEALHRVAFTRRSLFAKRLCTEQLLHAEAFVHRSFLHKEAFTQSSFYTQTGLQAEAFTERRFYAEQLYTKKLCNTEDFTQRRLYTSSFYIQKCLRTGASTQRSLYTQSSFCKQKLLRAEAFAQSHFYTQASKDMGRRKWRQKPSLRFRTCDPADSFANWAGIPSKHTVQYCVAIYDQFVHRVKPAAPPSERDCCLNAFQSAVVPSC